MKKTMEKQFSHTVLAASVAALGLFASPVAQAEESNNSNMNGQSNQIELGVGSVSNGSYKFGDYRSGLQESGAYLIGNVQIREYDNASYLEVNGRNLGMEGSRDYGFKLGELGNYGLSFEYSELSKLHSDSFMSPYNGMGTARLTAPAVWRIDTNAVTPGIQAPVAATNVTTTMMADLAANMKKFNVETRRKAAALGLTKQFDGGWDVTLNFKREVKDGTKLTGAPFQIAGHGNRGVLLAPEPINYTTDLLDTAVRYGDEKLHLQIGYHTSIFNNANRSLVFDNLFYNPQSTVGGSTLTGQLGQMPDNQFHQINASGGYTLSEETRLNGNLSVGRMTQNETFLPYITTAGILSAPPVSSLDGRVDVKHADIKLGTKLTRDLNLVIGYKYDDRDNRTPVNQYFYMPADNNSAATYQNNAASGNRRTNTPLSKNQRLAYADLDYRFSAATRLKLGYDYDKVTHTNLPTDGDRESTIRTEVTHSFSDTASGGLAYARSDRKAGNYNGAASLASTYQVGYLASLCVDPDGAGPLKNTFLYNGVVTDCTGTASATSTATNPFLDTPALRKYFLTNRKRDKLRAFSNIAADERLDLQFGASYYKERYPEAETGFGLSKATGWTANFDANLAATEEITGLFFASYESYETSQNGHNGTSSATAPAITTLDRQNNTAAFDPLTGTVARTDRSLTMGVGFRVKAEDSYEWGGNLTRTNTKGLTDFKDIGSRLTTVLPVPDADSDLVRLELFGKYKLQEDVSLNLNYTYEKYESTDWAWDGQTYTSSTSFVGSGQTSPDYSVNVVNVSLAYLF
ncbi:MAG: MtrB/PioB family decaheme-associated outer membrane protein [Gallionella sp.]|nr:MtrB/PioB family decaheme-associated outer membrane protein [Gallionella sp.]